MIYRKEEGHGDYPGGPKDRKIHSGIDFGAGVRIISEGRTSYAYTNDVISKSSKIANSLSKAVETGERVRDQPPIQRAGVSI